MRAESGIHVAIAAVLTLVAAAILVSLWIGERAVQGGERDPAPGLSPAPRATLGMQSQDPAADLVVINEVAPRRVRPGSKVTYNITVTNLGPDSATAVTLLDTLPEGTSPAKGNCQGRRIKCHLGTIGGGESTTLTLDVNVASDARGSLRNKTTVSSLTDDPDMGNNEAVATVRVQPPPRADLRLSKTLDSEEVLPGGTVRYSIRVTNAGPHLATAVTLLDTLPAEMSHSLRNCPGRRIRCYLGNIESGKSVTVTIDANVAEGAKGDLRNSASVSSLTADPRLSNNNDSAVMSVAVPRARDHTPTPRPSPTPTPTPTPVPTVIVPESEITPVPPMKGPGWESVIAVVHPDRVTRIALAEHGLFLVFPAISRARTFQVRVTPYDGDRVLQDPPPGLVLAAVQVEVFDTEGNLVEGVRLIFPANIAIALDAGQVKASGGAGELYQANLQGGLVLWTRSADDDPWRQVNFSFRLDPDGTASASVWLRYFSDFTLVLEQDEPPEPTPTPAPSHTPMPPSPPSVGDSSVPGRFVLAPGLVGLLLVLAGAVILGLGSAILSRHSRR